MLTILLPALLAQAAPAASPTPSSRPMPQCFREAQGALLKDGPFPDSNKGPAPYYAVVEMRINSDDSIKSVTIYKSSGIANYDRDALAMARQLLTLPEIAHCEHVESMFYYLHYPRGYTQPQFTPHP